MDNTSSNDSAEHRCEKCFKSYSRRDLLMRHRRRCQLRGRAVSKRKACSSCVKAKIKCSYTKPTCARCEKRGLSCEYLVHKDDMADENIAETSITESIISNEVISLTSNSPEDNVYLGSEVEMRELNYNFEWTAEMSSLVLDASDDTLAQFQAFEGGGDFCAESGISQKPELSTSIVSILRQYPKMLLSEDYRSPFLHRELYEGVGVDMTTLARTSMATICSAGLECKESRSYAIRAIEANRQNLIETFPKYSCLEQWDIIHAMLIYEALGLEIPHASKPGFWRPGYGAKGIKIPFLTKVCSKLSYKKNNSSFKSIQMAKSFCDGHPEVSPSALNSTHLTWQSWVTVETVRRTIFLANVVNYFANRDFDKGEQSLYYQELDRDLILDMSLPCSQPLWNATSEEQWMKSQTELNLAQSGAEQTSLRKLFSTYTRDQLLKDFGRSYGIWDSDSLRNFIVVAAAEQFI